MENLDVNYCFMAFAKGAVSTEGADVKRYIGVAPVFIKAVNPDKATLEKLYNTSLDNDPEYVTEKEGITSARINFIVKTDAEKCGIDFITGASFFIRKEYRFNKDQTKVQVIDKYGRTAWVTKEQCKNHEIPVYSNGPANLDKDYRACYVGEEELTNFLKNYMNIPNVQKYNKVENKWYMVDNPQDCEARLENIESYFKGDFSELRAIVAMQPENKVKLMFGVRTTDDNKQYQSVYTQMTLKNNVTDYSKLDEDLQSRKQAGAFATTEFEATEIREYTVEATDFNDGSQEAPFGAPTEGANSPWGN